MNNECFFSAIEIEAAELALEILRTVGGKRAGVIEGALDIALSAVKNEARAVALSHVIDADKTTAGLDKHFRNPQERTPLARDFLTDGQATEDASCTGS